MQRNHVKCTCFRAVCRRLLNLFFLLCHPCIRDIIPRFRSALQDSVNCEKMTAQANALEIDHFHPIKPSYVSLFVLCVSTVFFCAMLCISAVYAVMRCPSVRPSVVRLSCSWILSKRINIPSYFFSVGYVATPCSLFFYTKHHDSIPTGTPLTGASNADGVGKNRDSGRISGYRSMTAAVRLRIDGRPTSVQ